MAARSPNVAKGKDGNPGNPVAIFSDGPRVDAAVKQALRDARILHKRMGVGMVGWKDGNVVETLPEEIQIDEEPGGKS